MPTYLRANPALVHLCSGFEQRQALFVALFITHVLVIDNISMVLVYYLYVGLAVEKIGARLTII